ncbi:MAG: immune inhibitor A [Deltaproteobacteria bacterium]|nr:immune inhibitor A [Deltaproteobacteria bacterium]
MTAMIDRDTGVPLRMWGHGVAAPGAVTDAAIAEAAARTFLAQHIATLAPGSSSADFELVSNRLGGAGDTRSVGFAQRAHGLRVLGGSIGFTFKRDRLIMVGSTALPHVSVAAPANRLHFGSGKVMFDVPDRYPGAMRMAKPAPFANHSIGGTAATSTFDGTVTWAGTGSATVAPALRGPFVAISNAGGSLATGSLTLAAGGSTTWSMATSETADAQLAAFVHAGIVKQFAKTRLDPNLPWLDATLSVSVNEGSTCNAYSTGDDIHFYRKSSQCENTARLADVVYHEFGHSLHNHAIIEGVGSWDGALSEGMSDMLSALLTNDAGMGRGFFLSNAPMRNLDPAQDKRWPEDTTGQVHNDGEIIGGTMWDVKKALEAKLGAEAGHAKTVEIFYGILQRASDIPSSYAEALVSDDDDGDLANGTPNQCELNTVFKAHGLADGVVTAGINAPVRDQFAITLDVTPPSGDCPSPAVAKAEVEWRLRGGDTTKFDLAAGANVFEGSIPEQPSGSVIQYRVTVTLENGSSVSYPNNPADEYYEFYVGYTAPLWCADFEQRSSDWTTGGTGDDWEVGEPLGLASDPKLAFGGTRVFGTDLSKDGAYAKQSSTFAETIDIDLEGRTDARLHLRRWLGVEDGFYDNARILINGEEVWSNRASATEPQSNGTNHIDREWRFVDFDLAPYAAAGKVKLRFEIETDEGLQMGGWTLDDVCVVYPSVRPPNCGNGELDADEVCDDGNLEDGDGCSTSCDDENDGETPNTDADGGCCSSTTGAPGALALGTLVLGIVLSRRRSRGSGRRRRV